jgi:hypothetical protein
VRFSIKADRTGISQKACAPAGAGPIDYKYIFYRVPVKGYKKGREMMREKMETKGKNA